MSAPAVQLPAATADSRLERFAPALVCLLCLSPLVLQWSRFRNLYWFHDDWDLTSKMQRLPFPVWLNERYGENFSPVFNALWNGAILLVRGSYLGMILVVWATHLAILFLLAAILKRCGFSWQARGVAVVTLGMTWSNIETLGWAACWISPLSIFFLLAAWWLLLVADERHGSKALSVAAAACAAASALTFSRGVLTGVLLAFFLFWAPPGFSATAAEEHGNRSDGGRWRWLVAASLIAVTALSLLPYRWMLSGYAGFQQLGSGKLGAMASYGIHYELLSPLYHILPIPHKAVGLRDMMISGIIKTFIVTLGLLLAEERKRILLWTLLLLDLGMAGLLALGRYQLGIETSVSYRYQYVSLLCFAPFLAVVTMKGIDLLKRPAARGVAFALFFAGWTLLLGYPWARHSERWSRWRGTENRMALEAAAPEQRFGLPEITAGRARELIRIYGLH
jgi:hypothetical protein